MLRTRFIAGFGVSVVECGFISVDSMPVSQAAHRKLEFGDFFGKIIRTP